MKLVSEYTNYMCECAYEYYRTDIYADNIYYLIEKNAKENGLNRKEPTIFEGVKEIKDINKNMVLKVAEIYAKSIKEADQICGENNMQFDRSMSAMFVDIVCRYNYSDQDVEDLKNTIKANSEDKNYATSLSRSIAVAYINHKKLNQNGRWR